MRSSVALVVVAIVVAGCMSAAPATSPSPGLVSPTPTQAADPTPTQSAATPGPLTHSPMAGADLLRGTWSTDRVTQQEMDDTLREAGLQQWIQPFRALHADSPWRVFALSLDDDRWIGYWQTGDGAREPNDGPFPMRVEGDSLIYGPGIWSTTLRWTVAESSLTLKFVETTGPGFEGIPEEVFVRAFYTTAPFERD